MAALYFTLAAVALYFVANWLVDAAERVARRRFQHRTLLFFAILLTLALLTFWTLRHVLDDASGT